MPFQSEKQRRYLWANEPEIARDWTDTYGSRIHKDTGGITRIPFQQGTPDTWNVKRRLEGHEDWMGGPLMEYGQYGMPDLNKMYRLGMNEHLKRNQPISYSEAERIPNPDYYGLNIGRNYIPTEELPLQVGPYKGERYSIGDMKNIGLNQSDITHPIGDLPFNIDWLEKTYGKGINQIPNQFKDMYWGPGQGEEAENLPPIVEGIKEPNFFQRLGQKLGMTQVSPEDRIANEAFMAGANPWSQETGLQIGVDPQTGRMTSGDFAGKNVAGKSGWGSANFGEMAQSWMDKYGEMAYKTDKMKEKKKRIAKIARDHQRKLQQEREQTIKDYSTWKSPSGRDHPGTGGIGSPESRRGGAPGTTKGEASWKGYQGGRVPLADGSIGDFFQKHAPATMNLIGSIPVDKWAGQPELIDLESQYGFGSAGLPSIARHRAGMSNLSDTFSSALGGKFQTTPGPISQFLGDAGAFSLGALNEIPGVYRSITGDTPISETTEDIVSNWQGTFGTPYGKTSKDIYADVYGEDDDETGTIAFDPNNPQFNKAGLGVMSFLSSKLGPKLAAFIKNRALSKAGKTIGPKIKKTGKDIINPRTKTPHGGGGWKSPSGRDHVGTSGIGSAAAKSGPAGGSVGASRFR